MDPIVGRRLAFGCFAGEGLSGAVLGELKIVVKECLQIAEASFTPPQSAMVLPHIALEHRAVLPRRQAGWQRTLQVTQLLLHTLDDLRF